jgi:hypothetical protein
MATTQVSKRTRFAALGVSAVFSVGVLAPFIGTSSASAATCTSVNSSYTTANSKLAHDQHKLHKAKKKYKKAKRHDASRRVIKHRHHKVKKFKHKVRADKGARNHWSTQRTSCATSQQSAATSLGQFSDLLSQGLDPSQLTDALNTIASQLQSSGAPGADQLASAIKQISDAIASGASELDPADFQTALQDAADAIQNSATNPPTTAAGLIDAIVGPLADAFGEFPQAAQLSDALSTLQSQLDAALAPLPGLGSVLGGGGLPSLPTSGLPSLPGLG